MRSLILIMIKYHIEEGEMCCFETLLAMAAAAFVGVLAMAVYGAGILLALAVAWAIIVVVFRDRVLIWKWVTDVCRCYHVDPVWALVTIGIILIVGRGVLKLF